MQLFALLALPILPAPGAHAADGAASNGGAAAAAANGKARRRSARLAETAATAQRDCQAAAAPGASPGQPLALAARWAAKLALLAAVVFALGRPGLEPLARSACYVLGLYGSERWLVQGGAGPAAAAATAVASLGARPASPSRPAHRLPRFSGSPTPAPLHHPVLGVIMDGPAALALSWLGLQLVPHFRAPWLSTSVATFWVCVCGCGCGGGRPGWEGGRLRASLAGPAGGSQLRTLTPFPPRGSRLCCSCGAGVPLESGCQQCAAHPGV